MTSTTKGLLPPRLSTAQRDAVASPAAGLTIYNTTTWLLNTWDGTQWGAAVAEATGFASAKQLSHIYAGRFGRRPSDYLAPRK